MRLLFDENVSPKVAQILSREFPGSLHVANAGLRGADDEQIWDYARANDYTIVSKDTDFRERSFLEGAPPKVVWLDVGNDGTERIVDLMRRERSRLEALAEQQEVSFLILSRGPGAI